MSLAHVYLILGPAGAGRRRVLADLIANGLDPADRPVLLTAATETFAADEDGQRLGAIPSLVRETWTMRDGQFIAELPADVTHLFVLSHGRENPVDQIEAFHAWLSQTGGELTRVITVVDCKLGAGHPMMLRWYDACIHFSDVVLLSRRDGVPNKWVSDFIARYHKQHYPCLIELVKRTDFANPALLLEPQARRVSQLFDETDPISVAVKFGGDDDDEEGEEAEGDDEVVEEDAVPVDPYLERQAGSGRREKEIPDIAKFLPGRPEETSS
jgi:hypothetical protein